MRPNQRRPAKVVRNRVFVYPYKLVSGSAKNLASKLGTKRLKEQGNYIWHPNHTIINWGNSRLPRWATPNAMRKILNKPQFVENASDKIKTFQVLHEAGVPIPKFTQSRAEAERWLTGDAQFRKKLKAVVCRTLTRANSGRGIVLAKTGAEMVNAPLYTLYTPKEKEFRVHVVNGQIIDTQEKRRPQGAAEDAFNKYIRNHEQGWIFCRENVTLPDACRDAAIRAVEALHLNFGAVDMGYHSVHGVAVYEVNTAPGLEGQTLVNYANAFRTYAS